MKTEKPICNGSFVHINEPSYMGSYKNSRVTELFQNSVPQNVEPTESTIITPSPTNYQVLLNTKLIDSRRGIPHRVWYVL